MYKCYDCGGEFEFSEIAHFDNRNVTREEYMKLGNKKSKVRYRCPRCNGRIFGKMRPRTTRTVKAR